MHTHTSTSTHTHIHAHMLKHTQTYTCACKVTLPYLTLPYMHTHTCLSTYTHTAKHTHTHTQLSTHTHTLKHTQTHLSTYTHTHTHTHTHTRPAYPKILLSILRTVYVLILRFLTGFFADAPSISQNEAVSKVKFSTIYLVRTVSELTFSIIQTHYTRTTLFCLHLRKSFLIKDRRTLSPKTMHRVCCFR